MEKAVVKKGLLYLQQQQTFGKKWRKFWGVLYRKSVCAPACLELLEGSGPSATEKTKRAEGSRRLIVLSDCVHVAEAKGEASSPKETTSFLIETTEKCYLLAAERAEAQEWILELCEHAFLRNRDDWKALLQRGQSASFSVAENSLYSPTCKADALELRDVQKGNVLYSWPYKFLRRFGHDKAMFSFEAGRRCASGEGCFEFATKQGGEIIQVIEAAISVYRDAGLSGCPGTSFGASPLGRGTAQAKPDEGVPKGDKAKGPGEGLLSHAAVGTKSLSLESGWQGKPAKGKAVKPTSSCPLSGANCLSAGSSSAQPRRDPQGALGMLERAGGTAALQAKGAPESEYAEPFDTLSKPGVGAGGTNPSRSAAAAPAPSVSYGAADELGLPPARVGPEHIYDEPDGLGHAVYDEPQEPKGEAWKLQATAEDPGGYEYPYDPSADDYAVPKMSVSALVQPPGQDPSGPGETAFDNMVLRLKKVMNAQ